MDSWLVASKQRCKLLGSSFVMGGPYVQAEKLEKHPRSMLRWFCVGKCEGACSSGPRVPTCGRLLLVSSCGRALARQLWWRQLSDDLADT